MARCRQRISLLGGSGRRDHRGRRWLLSVGLIVNAESSTARHTLASIADATQTASDAGATAAGELRARRLLQVLQVQYATLNRRGQVTFATDSLAQDAVQPPDVARLSAGNAVSTSRSVGRPLGLVEGRPTRAGAVVVVQRRSDATRRSGGWCDACCVALAIAVAVAALLGVPGRAPAGPSAAQHGARGARAGDRPARRGGANRRDRPRSPRSGGA